LSVSHFDASLQTVTASAQSYTAKQAKETKLAAVAGIK